MSKLRFAPAVNAATIGQVLPPFFALAGEAAWRERAAQLTLQIEKRPWWANDLAQRHAIELAAGRVLHLLAAEGRWPAPQELADPGLYALASLATAVLSVGQSLSEKGNNRLRGNVRDALKRDFQSLAFEMSVLSDYMHRGFEVDPVDLESLGGSACEFLVSTPLGDVEVECKFVSSDLGRKIHRAEFASLLDEAAPALLQILSSSGCSFDVGVTLRNRLEGAKSFLQGLSSAISRAIKVGEASDASWRVRAVPCSPSPQRLEVLTERTSRSRGGHAFVLGERRGESIALSIRSQRSDDLVGAICERLLEASKRQLSGVVPGYLEVFIDEIDDAEWESLGASNTGLTVMSNVVLGRRGHLAGLAYSSRGNLVVGGGHVQQSGKRLCFSREEGHPHKAIANLLGGVSDGERSDLRNSE